MKYIKKIDELINLICLFKLLSFMKLDDFDQDYLHEEMAEFENLIFLCKHNPYYKNKIIIIFEIQVSLCMQKYAYTGDYSFKHIANQYKKMIDNLAKELVRPMMYIKIEHKFNNAKSMLPKPKLYV
jgi:hypothetical protein